MIRTKIKKGLKKKNTVVVSGYFNPLHIGHINYLKEAKEMGRRLIVIINNDEQVKIKGSVPFMSQEDRMKIVMALRYVDMVLMATDKDGSVCETLKMIFENYKEDGGKFIFANGGDRKKDNVPEDSVCEELGIETVYGVGGEKIESSSWLIHKANVKKNIKKNK